MRTFLSAAFALLLPLGAFAQSSATPVPEKHIPAPVLMDLRQLESQFDLFLSRDCAPEKCVSKGCSYRDHAVVDIPRNSSLPGLGQNEGVGAVPPQEYLTQARCEFAHEKSISAKDVQALVKRLEQRLSKGWLQVTVTRQVLEPISAALAISPPPLPEPVVPTKVEPPPAPPAPPPKFEWDVALRELWLGLLPHFSWMIALLLGTLATLAIIWGGRRLGKESLEEKAMMAQLAAGALEAPKEEPAPIVALPTDGPEQLKLADKNLEDGFVTEQQRLWTDRIAQAELATDQGGVVELLRAWLRAGEFAYLAKAIFVFGDRLSLAFSSDGQLAVRKVEFAEYLKTLDEKSLPSDADFFRVLNHHAISSSLLAQSDAESYRSLREEFGADGLAHLIESLPPRNGALLFAMVPTDCQHEVARALNPELRLQVATQLLVSNRISNEERQHLFETLDNARAGLPLQMPAQSAAHEIVDRGREFDAAGALSVLCSHLEPEDRKAVFAEALKRGSGTHPAWYEEILYPDMLFKVPSELQADLLLEVDIKGLAAWTSIQPAAWQEGFLTRLSPTLQNAIRANTGLGTRVEQLQSARRGHHELVTGLKKLVARGKVSFAEIVA
jgi:hypothetical protein